MISVLKFRRVKQAARATSRLEGRSRIDLDGRHDGRDELEENDEVEINSHAFDLLVVGIRGDILARTACFAAKRPLLSLRRVLRGGARSRALARELLGDDAVVHALDDFLHHARMLARVHACGLQRCGVDEGLDCHRLVRMVRRDVLEYLCGREGRAVLL